jgi:hypothetical protein
MTSPSATPNSYRYQNEPIWSRSEKRIVRKVFDAVLHRELHEVMQETTANQISDSADLWHLERYLIERRKEIDRKYDLCSSQLARAFGRLLSERRVSEVELHGLRHDKLEAIHSCAKVLADDDAA